MIGGHIPCPSCGVHFSFPKKLQGRTVKCRRCGGAIRIPQKAAGTDSSGSAVLASNQPAKTDIFAILCLASGGLSLILLPLLLMPMCYICGIVSYYRLKENPSLKGQGLRVVGWILGSITFLYLLWLFEIGPFANP